LLELQKESVNDTKISTEKVKEKDKKKEPEVQQKLTPAKKTEEKIDSDDEEEEDNMDEKTMSPLLGQRLTQLLLDNFTNCSKNDWICKKEDGTNSAEASKKSSFCLSDGVYNSLRKSIDNTYYSEALPKNENYYAFENGHSLFSHDFLDDFEEKPQPSQEKQSSEYQNYQNHSYNAHKDSSYSGNHHHQNKHNQSSGYHHPQGNNYFVGIQNYTQNNINQNYHFYVINHPNMYQQMFKDQPNHQEGGHKYTENKYQKKNQRDTNAKKSY